MLYKLIKTLSYPLGVLFLLYFFVYPVFVESVDKQQKLTEEKSKLEALKKEVGLIDDMVNNYVSYVESEDGKKDVAFVDLAIPSYPNIHDVIISIYNKKDRASVDFVTVEPSLDSSSVDEGENEDVYKLRLSVNAIGTYESIESFIHFIEMMDRVFIIEEVNLTKDDSAQVTSNDSGVVGFDNINLQIEGYVLYGLIDDDMQNAGSQVEEPLVDNQDDNDSS